MKNRHWLLPAAITSVVILLVAGAIVLAFKPKPEVLTGMRIPVNSEVALRHVGTLTDKQQKYSEGGWSWKDALWNRLPEGIRMRFFSGYQPTEKFEVQYSGIDPGDFRLIMRVEYPKSWLPASNPWDVENKIRQALEDAGSIIYRIVYERSYRSSQTSAELSSGPGVYTHGKVTDAKPYVTLRAENVPIYAKELELQFLSDWDENSTVTRSVKIPNPYFREIEPLPEPAAPLPQRVADAEVAVTLRNLVSKSTENYNVDFRTSGAEEVIIGRAVGKAVPVPDEIPSEFFPRGDEGGTQPYHTVAVFAISQKGRSEPEWGVSDIDVFYGKSLHEWGINSWGSMGNPAAYFVRFSGDLTEIKQPVKVVATLDRKNSFPPDEFQIVEMPLPKEGEAVTSAVTVVLWDKQIPVEQVAYKVKGDPNDFLKPSPDSFSIRLGKGGEMGVLREVYFIKDDRSTISLRNLSSGSTSYSDRGTVFNYDLKRNIGWQRDSKPVVYDDYTSIGLQFVSPRKYPKQFEFLARPAEATGKYVPE